MNDTTDANVVFLVKLRFGADIKAILGPYATEHDAEVARNTAKQMDFEDTMANWGQGDTNILIEPREVIE